MTVRADDTPVGMIRPLPESSGPARHGGARRARPWRWVLLGVAIVVVVVGTIHELPVQTPIRPHRVARHTCGVQGGVADRPAGEGTRALAHIDLGIVSHPHGEQF